MKININFKGRTLIISDDSLTLKGLITAIQKEITDELPEVWKISFYDENTKDWSLLDETIYKKLIEADKGKGELQLKIADKSLEDSFTIISNHREREISEVDISREKIHSGNPKVIFRLN